MEITNKQNLSQSLNESQLKAVEYCDGPALVIAGAGSGKTRVLVKKIIHLINIGYDPYSIMALTFTNKAAKEMRERVYNEIGKDANRIIMGTFHSVFSRILREHAECIEYKNNFSIYNANDSKNRIKSIIKELELDEKEYNPLTIQKRISKAKNNLILPSMYINNPDIQKEDYNKSRPKTGEIYSKYNKSLKESNAMDFDDLLLLTNVLFRDNPDVLELWQDRIKYLLVDEYQDTNLCQYMISKKIVEKSNNIFVVGDDAQSIYAFRGAKIDNILNFQNNFANAKIFKLEQNYRSTKTIVNVANELIKKNKKQHFKEIFSNNKDGDPIVVYRAESPEEEAERIARIIEINQYTKKNEYKDFVILYRNNSQSRILEQVLRRNAIPFKILGGMSFFNHKEIMDIMAYFRLIVNDKDDEALLRIINYPKRNIGDTTIDKIKQISATTGLHIMDVIKDEQLLLDSGFTKAKTKYINTFVNLIMTLRDLESSQDITLLDKVKEIILLSGIYKELEDKEDPIDAIQKKNNVDELIVSVGDYIDSVEETGQNPSLVGYLSEISLYSDLKEIKDEDADVVSLMTIHSSKGLEFPYVFIVGVEENIFPSVMNKVEDENIEEERRLMYVAITRAKDTCHISFANERFNFKNGRLEKTEPSRFIGELPKPLIKANFLLPKDIKNNRNNNEKPRNVITKTKRLVPINSVNGGDITNIQSIKPNDKVEHLVFGKGYVKEIIGSGNNTIACIKFDSGEEKKLLLRFAKLKKI